jgi:hypothetical protein
MKIKKFQMGGAMDPAMAGAEMGAEAGAAAGAEAGAEMGAEGGGDPVMELVQMAAQALEAQDPNMAMAVCEGLVSLVQGGAPAPGGAEEPVMMRRGGKMCGAKKKAKKC